MASSKSDFVVVANRLPVRRVKRDGRTRIETSPGGLVSALLPILRGEGGAASAERGCWIGWNGTPGKTARAPFEHDGVRNVPVAISKAELEGYYEGIANSSIWPLYHDAVRPPAYRRRWWPAYAEVNRRFAEAAAREAAKGAFVWVHDYHLHLAPRMLRELRPDLRIGFFLHIPFPGRGLFAQIPWRQLLLEGTLGADVIGFQTKFGAKNFVDLAVRYTDATRAQGGVKLGKRKITVGAFPISIDFDRFDALARSPGVVERAATLRQRLGNRKLILGVDRMDYTKGIDIRLRAVHELLRSGAISMEDVVMVQSAVPTRERVEDYAELRSKVEELVGQINGEFGEVGLIGVQYVRQSLPPDELAALYVAADVMLVTPIRDGMNLVAKEFVACRHKEDGALVLSEFTGAAHELTQALLVNPHDIDALAAAIERAVHISPQEAQRRMRAMRRAVQQNTVYDWARGFTEALAA